MKINKRGAWLAVQETVSDKCAATAEVSNVLPRNPKRTFCPKIVKMNEID